MVISTTVISTTLILDAVSSIQTFVDIFVAVYWLVLFVYILSSWVRLPYAFDPVQRFLRDTCEPYIRLFRRILPSQFGPFDLSPMIAMFALVFVGGIVHALLNRLH